MVATFPRFALQELIVVEEIQSLADYAPLALLPLIKVALMFHSVCLVRKVEYVALKACFPLMIV
jgi:hypothetical protein